MIGYVKAFLTEKGYGFIRTESGSEYFCHQTQICMDGYRALTQGEYVEFDVEMFPDGRRQAVNITRIPEVRA